MPRGRFTAAIVPILVGAAAAVLIGNAPSPGYAPPAPLLFSVRPTLITISYESQPTRTPGIAWPPGCRALVTVPQAGGEKPLVKAVSPVTNAPAAFPGPGPCGVAGPTPHPRELPG
jgi:hypothetical protein